MAHGRRLAGLSSTISGTYATLVLLDGVPAEAASEVLGDNGIATTLHACAHGLPGARAQAARSASGPSLLTVGPLSPKLSPGGESGDPGRDFVARADLRRSGGFVRSAGGGTRTHTRLPSPDFESGASTDSATPARKPRLYHGPYSRLFC